MAQRGISTAAMIEPTIVELREDPVVGYRLFVGEQETTMANVAALTFESIMAADPSLVREDVLRDGRVYIRADLDVAYQNVVNVTDRLQTEGFAKVSVAAQRVDEE
jgi:biopolymer transport protein ExbD